MKKYKMVLFLIVTIIGSSFSGWGISDWVKLGTCISYPSYCPAVYVEEEAAVIEDATEALVINLGFAEKEACGNLGDELSESFSTQLFIPDYFPPDENASQEFVDMLVQFGTGMPGFSSAMDACIVEGTARLFHACEQHDFCMEDRNAYDGDECDRKLLSDWESKCMETYGEFSPCKAACIGIVNISWKIMVTQTSDFMATSKKIVPTAIVGVLLLS